MRTFAIWMVLFPVGFGAAGLTAADRDSRWLTAQPLPSWVWDAEGTNSGQEIYLQKTFPLDGKVQTAKLYTTCDNSMTLWINGKRIASSRDWPFPIQQDVAKFLRAGENTISVKAKNAGGIAAFVFKLSIERRGRPPIVLVSDTSWSMSRTPPANRWYEKNLDAASWTGRLKTIKPLGEAPWGIPSDAAPSVTAASDIRVPAGFEVDLVHALEKEEQGSWVALTTGPAGKLVACDQGDKGAFLIDVRETSDGPEATVVPIVVNQPGTNKRLSGAQGLLWTQGALWFHKNGGHLYRLSDSNGDGTLDHAEELPSGTGGGEHGNHALIETKDGNDIYMAGGNHAPLYELASSSVPTWDEDLLLPRMWDANGHARGRLAPGGWVTRLDTGGYGQHLVCIGFRNQYDIALNRHGDMFTYDADMEWDLGMPWYRPTRICHVVSGGDYGWRSGTGKWPTYFEDSLPPVVEVGPGSPTGVVAGIGAKFPANYQEAIFALDWTFGTIYAIHLTPIGAGYHGSVEPFATGSPLPVTDAVVASDGALYFTIGGRGTQSALYRIRYAGDRSTEPVTSSLLADIVQARLDRKNLEQFHTPPKNDGAAGEAIDTAWPFLASEDRFLRGAARVAIESQPVELWAARAIAEADPQAFITASVALARTGNETHQPPLMDRFVNFPVDSISDGRLLGLLRAVSLTCLRLGRPDDDQSQALVAKFDPLLPHTNDDVNTELVKLLVYLRSPSVIEKAMYLITNRQPTKIPDWSELASRNARYGATVKKVLDNHPPSRELGYALALRNVRQGWTIEQRRDYFRFLNAAAKASGGASYPGFLQNIREEALANCSDAERLELQDITGEDYDPKPDFEIAAIRGPGKAWTIGDAQSEATRFRNADFESGRSLYFAANCGKCHRYAGLGGNIGPDLTSIPNKFDVNYVIEHIIEPSKVISDQYQSSTVLTVDGRTLTGLVSEADGQLVVYPADVKTEPITLASDDVEVMRPSPVSQMPKGLIDGLNADELRDLLAYLMSGGDPNNRKVYGRR